ncbi:uncharacterized protein Tco025E_08066 [Trypanosoma conorhini]|uniref:Uncharacterized protein n=1 Tax=Trypanosoma conorhini TaxID=83891 RepID=A0A422NEJ8_9TRYP|nr:uncharacterized protein Tco025E_08066 [Trypanosoma conorhini]RNF03880.1 hypothetical protein Tco025E_08066 [Trypanosoma conorhini]
MTGEDMWVRFAPNGRPSDTIVEVSTGGGLGQRGRQLLAELPLNAEPSDAAMGEFGKTGRSCCRNPRASVMSSRRDPLWQATRLTSPYCVLMANGVQDDFYTSCLSWGRENVVLALRDEVLLFQPSRSPVRPAVLNLKERGCGLASRVTSVAVSRFSDNSCFLGELDGSVGVYASPGDGPLVRTSNFAKPPSPLENTPLAGEAAMSATASVRCLATTDVHPWLVAAGTAAQGLFILDSRCPTPAAQIMGCDTLFSLDRKRAKPPLTPEDLVSLLASAEGICGVSWNASGSLVATGGSGGVVNIWSLSHTRAPVQQIRLPNAHTTVKAVAFHPTLPYEVAVGGGRNDGMLRLYDVSSSVPQLAWCVSTGCQVTQALYSPDGAFVISAQGDRHAKPTAAMNAVDGDAQPLAPRTLHPAGDAGDVRRGGMNPLERLTVEFERGMTRSGRAQEGSQEPTPNYGEAAITGTCDSRRSGDSPAFALVMWRRGTQHRDSMPLGFASSRPTAHSRSRPMQESAQSALPLFSMYVMTGHRSRPLQLTAPFSNTLDRGSVVSLAGGVDNTIRFWKCFSPRNEAANWEQRNRASMRAAVTDEDVKGMMATPLR